MIRLIAFNDDQMHVNDCDAITVYLTVKWNIRRIETSQKY